MQAFKYELQPDGEQERDMRRISGACRFVFNKVLTIQKENYETGNKFIGIGNARKDFLHKTTTTISKNHALVCVEDLQVKSMSKTAAGIKEQPGKQVCQKSALNRSILDQGWGMFRSQLEYKLEWNGEMLLAVAPENTSRTCPNCEHISEHNRKTQSQFECVSCGYRNNADIVGAINILERGHRLLACGEMVHLSRSKKQLLC